MGRPIRIEAHHRSDALALMRTLSGCRPYLVQLTAERWEVRAERRSLDDEGPIREVEEWARVRHVGPTTVVLEDGTSRQLGL
jgi:hypothetical protein